MSREHGELSHHQAGPDATRHKEDLVALLTAQRDDARQRAARAEDDFKRAERDATRWHEQVNHYDQLLEALVRVETA